MTAPRWRPESARSSPPKSRRSRCARLERVWLCVGEGRGRAFENPPPAGYLLLAVRFTADLKPPNDQTQASCEADLAAAEPLLAQAEAALDTLNKKDLGETKSLKKPPPGGGRGGWWGRCCAS
jgi:hypothetical protein